MVATDLNLKRHAVPINRDAARERLLVFSSSFSPGVFSSQLIHSSMHIQIYNLVEM